jgi:hypothetical protein
MDSMSPLMIDEINDIRNQLKLIPTFTSGCGFNSYQIEHDLVGIESIDLVEEN